MVLIVIGMGVISAVSYFSAENALVKSYNQQLRQISHSNSEFITAWIQDRKRDVTNWSEQKGFMTALQDTFVGKAARKSADVQLKKMKEDYKYFETLNIANPKGEIVSASVEDVIGKINVYDRDYFKEAMKGAQFVSNVTKSRATGNPVFFIASPIEEKGNVTGIFFGVVDLSVFNKMFIDDIKVGENGYAYIYQPDGLVLAHPDKANILTLNMNEFDFGKDMIAKGSGIITYTWKGAEKVVAFDKEPELGWTIGVGAATGDFLAPVRRIGYLNLIVTVSMAVLAAIVIFLLAGSITRGIQRISVGLRDGAVQVSNASNQIATSSQSLAEGASEQAASIEETASSLEQMSSMTRQNAQNADQADNLMKEANEIVGRADGAMSELTVSMSEISKASEETSKIIKTIDEIAFQTNLLALNAAVEAARAGEAGAGFAVVADEVRNLAMRAADAARNTATLIEETVKKVGDGSTLVSRTNEAFGEVAEVSAKVGDLVAEIAAASQEQAQGIEQVNKAVAQMDKVVQQNAANAEESASASGEMNSQSRNMRRFVEELVTLIRGGSSTDSDVKTKMADRTMKRRGAERPAQAAIEAPKSRKPAGRAASPQAIIPLDDDEEGFKDF